MDIAAFYIFVGVLAGFGIYTLMPSSDNSHLKIPTSALTSIGSSLAGLVCNSGIERTSVVHSAVGDPHVYTQVVTSNVLSGLFSLIGIFFALICVILIVGLFQKNDPYAKHDPEDRESDHYEGQG